MQDAVEAPLARGTRGPRPQPASARGGALGRAGWNIDRLRVLPGTFWRGWLVVVLARSAQFVEPFLPVLLLVELRATSELVAGVLVAAQLAATVGVAAAGPLMDRWGPVRVLRVALAGSAVTCAALAATPGPVVAVPAAIGFGVASAIWRAAAQVVVPAALARPGVPANARATAFGLLVWASNLGAVLSAAVGAAGAPVRFLFLVQTAVLVGAAVLARILHTPRSVPRTSAEPVTTSSAVRAPDVGLWVLAAGVAPRPH
jgi:MFS family permease